MSRHPGRSEVVDYAIAMLPAWLTLNLLALGDTIALGGAVRGGLRGPVIVLRLLFPQFFPRDAMGLYPSVVLLILAAVYFVVLLVRPHRSWAARVMLGTAVWLGMVTLGYLADKLAGGTLVFSRGGPFRYYLQLDVFSHLLAYQVRALVPSVVLVSILSALRSNNGARHLCEEKPRGTQ